MKESILNKLDNLQDRFGEVEALLSDADTIADQNKFRELSKEYSELEGVVKHYNRYKQVSDDLQQAQEMQRQRQLLERSERTSSITAPGVLQEPAEAAAAERRERPL